MFKIWLMALVLLSAEDPLSAHDENSQRQGCEKALSFAEAYNNSRSQQNFYEYSKSLAFPQIANPIRYYTVETDFINGRLYPVSKLEELPDGFQIFVLTKKGLLTSHGTMTSDGVKAPPGHKNLARLFQIEEGDIEAAGEFYARDGKILWLGNRSGRFPREFETLKHFLEFFSRNDLADVISDTFYYEETEQGPIERPAPVSP